MYFLVAFFFFFFFPTALYCLNPLFLGSMLNISQVWCWNKTQGKISSLCFHTREMEQIWFFLIVWEGEMIFDSSDTEAKVHWNLKIRGEISVFQWWTILIFRLGAFGNHIFVHVQYIFSKNCIIKKTHLSSKGKIMCVSHACIENKLFNQ